MPAKAARPKKAGAKKAKKAKAMAKAAPYQGDKQKLAVFSGDQIYLANLTYGELGKSYVVGPGRYAAARPGVPSPADCNSPHGGKIPGGRLSGGNRERVLRGQGPQAMGGH